jgi:hypothetical protein
MKFVTKYHQLPGLKENLCSYEFKDKSKLENISDITADKTGHTDFYQQGTGKPIP